MLAALDRRPVDRIPTDYWAVPEVTDRLLAHFAVVETVDLWLKLGIDKIINIKPKYVGPPLVDNDEVRVDYWGVERRRHEHPGGVYFEISRWPLAAYPTIDEIAAKYTWPSADWFDFSDVADECARYPNYAIEAGYMAPFFMFNNGRGLEQSLLDMGADPDLAQYVIDRSTDFLIEYHHRLFEAGRGRIDLTQVTDDLGCQHGLLISPASFDRFLTGAYERCIGLAKAFGIRVFHHDDGAMADMLPRLVGLGIQVLNPIQWRLPGMNPARLKREYGGRIAFHGGIDNQYVLPFGTLAEVEDEVGYCLSTLASDGTGYVLAPCHNIQGITPIENVIRMYEAAISDGRQ
jgi:uroporphyrinogen decarboxylase